MQVGAGVACPYSHSLPIGVGLGAVLWALLRWVFRRPQLAAVFGWVAACHVVLDVIQHEPNIRLVPWLAHPVTGLNLQANPWLDVSIETALRVGCWSYYRGSRKPLAAIIILNALDLPLMLAARTATPDGAQLFVLPTTILITILLAWAVIHRYARPTVTATAPQVPARTPASAAA